MSNDFLNDFFEHSFREESLQVNSKKSFKNIYQEIVQEIILQKRKAMCEVWICAHSFLFFAEHIGKFGAHTVLVLFIDLIYICLFLLMSKMKTDMKIS